MEKWYAVDASFGSVEIHDIISWRQLQELFREIMMSGELRYIEIDETDQPAADRRASYGALSDPLQGPRGKENT